MRLDLPTVTRRLDEPRSSNRFSIGDVAECASDLADTSQDPRREALVRASETAQRGDSNGAQMWTSVAFLLARGHH